MGCCLTRLYIYIAVMCLVGWLFCDINPEKTYTWYSGIWHGLFFIPNLIRSWFGDALYKANFYTDAYNVWWWITTIMSCISTIFRWWWKKIQLIINKRPLVSTKN